MMSSLEPTLENLTDSIQDGIQNVQQKVKKLSTNLQDNLEKGKMRTAETLDSTSKTLENTSEKMNTAACYIVEKNSQEMLLDLYHVIRRNPFKSLIVVGLLGLFLASAKKSMR